MQHRISDPPVIDMWTHVSVDPRRFELSESWFDPSLDRAVMEGVSGLLTGGTLPPWPVVVPQELRTSRKLAFRVGHEIVVVAGVGLVQKLRDRVIVTAPQTGRQAPEGTVIHDSYISHLDLKRDPLGGLSRLTVRLALRRMACAQEIAGSMGIIPRVIGHGVLLDGRRDQLGFLIYAYPAAVEKPAAWPCDDPGFDDGIEHMARFLAALHRRTFHGDLYRAGTGFANTLWTTSGKVIPVVTGWGQHTGLINSDLAMRDVGSLLLAGFAQLQAQHMRDLERRNADLARRVLLAYGQMRAAFAEHAFEFDCDPLASWNGSFDALVGPRGLVEQWIAHC